MIALALALFLQIAPPHFKEPVKITEKQSVLLKAEAEKVRERLKNLRKGVGTLERPAVFGLKHENSPQNYADLKATLVSSISAASEAASKTRGQFIDLSENEPQKQSAEVFFGDILARYAVVSHEIGFMDARSYSGVRDKTFNALELNALAYETVAAAGSDTFDLVVQSMPPIAGISYKREGESYTDNQDPTDTTISNLTYAVWTIRVQKPGYEDQEKTHDPYREKNHIVHFDLKKK